jgi:molecular chaperone DnaJ
MANRDWLEKDFYRELGVAKDASQDEIKKAYRKIARENHPDTKPGDAKAEARFKAAGEAYGVLSDPTKRSEYDEARTLMAGGRFGGFGGGGGRGGATSAPGGFDVNDLFGGAGRGGGGAGGLGDLLGGIFGGLGGRGGGTRTQRQPVRGNDVEAVVHLSFEDSLHGVEAKVPVELTTACRECAGTGAQPGTAPVICPECNGRGVKAESQGLFALSQPCPRCRGNGTVIEQPCPHCHGSGRERRIKTYTVKIKPGVKDGTRIKLKGKGEPGENGGPAGDLVVVTRVTPSSTYERRGDDLVVQVPVSYATATLGGSVEVPTPDGPVSLKIPAGSEDGKLLRIKGRGAPKLNGSGKGDVLARVRIQVPKRVNKKERELLEELKKVGG